MEGSISCKAFHGQLTLFKVVDSICMNNKERNKRHLCFMLFVTQIVQIYIVPCLKKETLSKCRVNHLFLIYSDSLLLLLFLFIIRLIPLQKTFIIFCVFQELNLENIDKGNNI